MLAHSKFEAGDFLGCIGAFEAVLDMSLTINKTEIATRALFSSSRAYLELFRASKNPNSWDKAKQTLDTCQSLCLEHRYLDLLPHCYVMEAMLYHAQGSGYKDAFANSLKCITAAQRLWRTGRSAVRRDASLDDLLTKYAITGRWAKSPQPIYGLAVEMCIELGKLDEAFNWAEYGKAQAFLDGLTSNELQPDGGQLALLGEEELPLPTLEASTVFVHWVMNGDTTYICTRRGEQEYASFKLDILTSVVEEWHRNFVATKEDLTDVESAKEILSELEPLCRPLIDYSLAKPGEHLILCPTGVLFKIPLHAIPITGASNQITLLERHPIVYAHSLSTLQTYLTRPQPNIKREPQRITIFGNSTGDTPAGGTSAQRIAKLLNSDSFTHEHTTKDRFLSQAATSSLIHNHGHALSGAYSLDQAIIFHEGERLKAREVFGLKLASRPVVVLISCGSGVERLDAGDEPLGLVSAFLYVGASAVVATMWPIHDKLAGAAFSEEFYRSGEVRGAKGIQGQRSDIAQRLQRAALKIKAQKETKAPYYWAGFVMYGNWKSQIDDL